MASTADEVEVSAAEDEDAENRDAENEAAAGEQPTLSELLVQLGRDVTILAFCETQIAASRHLPEVRRAARDIAGTLVAALALLTAFVFVNVAALAGLATTMPVWAAALVLCAAWLVLGSALIVALMVRTGQVTGWSWWRVFRGGPQESRDDLERARDDAEAAVRETLARLAPAMTVEIAAASVSVAGGMAGDMAGDVVVEAGEAILETSDEVVEAITENLPGGGVVNQMWDVVLIPGRFGVKVAATVFRRGGPTGER